MKKVIIRFYAELNDFLPVAKKQSDIEYCFKGMITTREAIESLGVPHSAVDLILINGQPEDFTVRLNPDDRISVYPEFEMLDISEVTRLRKEPLRSSRFIADAHLGKVARNLRMLGFDTLFSGELTDREIIEVSNREKRIILTRDRDLLKSHLVGHGYYVRATGTDDQMKEIILKFDLAGQFKPFTRCLVCNGILADASQHDIQHLIKPELLDVHQAFFCCTDCGRIYWEGSHYNRMLEKINKLSEDLKSS